VPEVLGYTRVSTAEQEGGGEGGHGSRPDPPQRECGARPDIIIRVIEGNDEGGHGVGGSRPDPPQRECGARPDIVIRVIEGSDEGGHGVGAAGPIRPSANAALDRTLSLGPEVTNGPFLSHKGTEQERRCAGSRVIPPRRAPQPAHGVDGKQVFPVQAAHTLQIAGNWQPIVSLGHHASSVPPMSAYVSNLSVPLLLAVQPAQGRCGP
jgi:hypothetical protein